MRVLARSGSLRICSATSLRSTTKFVLHKRSARSNQLLRRASTMVSSDATGIVESKERFIDIGVNLTDPVFRGIYHGRRKHDDDFELMLERARSAGVKSMIITGGSLKESKEALEVAKKNDMFATVGCHPTRSAEFDKFSSGAEGYLKALEDVIKESSSGKGRVVAVGECGLDYDRLHYATEEVQQKHFKSQLSLAKQYHLPLFLHSRAAHADFVRILREEGFGEDGGRAVGGKGGVVHSFTGSEGEAAELLAMGFHIGINGCSLKTEANLAVAKSIPLDRLMLETDAPWCSMTSGHASKELLETLPGRMRDAYLPPARKAESFIAGKAVKGRNEPAATGAVAWVVQRLHEEVSFEEVAEHAWKNTVEVFGLDELS